MRNSAARVFIRACASRQYFLLRRSQLGGVENRRSGCSLPVVVDGALAHRRHALNLLDSGKTVSGMSKS
jgi:hypothetical protein